MKIDYHVHLEEGPYSLRWLERTNQAISHFKKEQPLKHTKEWLSSSMAQLNVRLETGAYSKEWLRFYLKKAKERGIQEVGIVDHLYRFKDARPYFETYMTMDETELGKKQRIWLDQVMTEDIEEFVHTIEEAKSEWAQEGIALRLGVEADYFPGGEQWLKSYLDLYPWDYIIGSTHFVEGWGFDNPETKETFTKGSLIQLYETFFGAVEQSIRSGLFDIVAHLDNLKVFNYRPHETDLLPFYERIAQALIEVDTATEINSGLYYRYPVKEMCPSPTFLSVLVQHGVTFTTSSDSHFPDDVGSYIDEGQKMLVQYGVKELCTFQQRQRIMKPII
ncbi:histidinol phosphate phosphatase domain-containing protein [Bacillus sp. REN10]|uniref:histidinol phosphate phosphatase domain-containing protein n=1 Tax=Bacillus sp. REN10 TaxID=2782541 RepID=UPI00193C1185|nr:histidinol phosphate phosphatase domain-containing protein [Bacillus sp. REN10]